jgi:hypothetical protein
MLDDIAYGVRWLTAFVTGRGATALAVAGAVAAGVTLGSPVLPLIGLALGIPVTAALATMSHDHQQRQLRAHYREEIAATLGIAPGSVTMQHLRAVANGMPDRRIPGNKTLHEALERNDRHRTIAVVANVLSAIVATGLVFALHTFGLPGAASGWLANAGVSLTQAGAMEATLLATTAAVTGFGLDQLFGHAGNRMFGYTTPSLDDQIERVAGLVRRGHSMGIGQMMRMIVQVNPSIDQEIRARYGLSYRQLPPEHQRDVINHYDNAFQIRATTEAINRGLLPAQELAFAVEGRRSGVLPPATALLQAYASELEKAKAEGLEIPARPHTQRHALLERVPGVVQAQRFVDRVRGLAPQQGLSHVQRLEQQAAQHADTSKAIH